MKELTIIWCLLTVGVASSQTTILLLDKEGKVIPEMNYDFVVRLSSDSIPGKIAFAGSINKKIGFYAFDGKEILPPTFDFHEAVTGLDNGCLLKLPMAQMAKSPKPVYLI